MKYSQPKILAQVKPAAGTLTDLYTPPPKGHAHIPIINIGSNATSGETSFLKVAPGGEADNAKHFILNGFVTARSQLNNFEAQLFLAPGDVLRGKSTNGTVTFTVCGTEDL